MSDIFMMMKKGSYYIYILSDSVLENQYSLYDIYYKKSTFV